MQKDGRREIKEREKKREKNVWEEFFFPYIFGPIVLLFLNHVIERKRCPEKNLTNFPKKI